MSKIANRWLKTPGGGSDIQETPSGSINGVNKNFVLTQDPTSGSLKVFLNGLKDNAFTYSSPSKTVTMTTAPVVGQSIEAVYKY